MSESSNRQVVERFVDAVVNDGDFETFDELVADEYSRIDESDSTEPIDKTGFRTSLEELRGGFSDIDLDLEAVHTDGEYVVMRGRMRGTHDGPFMNVDATNRPVDVSGITIHRVVDGQIVESWANWDFLGLLSQVGAIPKPGTPQS